MKKKILAILLCTAMFIIPAYAAMGAVHGYAQLDAGNVMLPYQQGYDWVKAYTYSEEYQTVASNVKNIFAQANVVDRDSGDTYETAYKTEHYVLSTSALTDQVIRNWNLSTLRVKSMGTARTRYINDTTSQRSFNGTVGEIGGENLKSTSTISTSANEETTPMGYGKGDRLAAVAQDVFNLDLSNFQYISCGELCAIGEKGTENLSGRDLAMSWLFGDILISTQKGEKIPLGYFYRGNTVYTVTEQRDGTVKLMEYTILTDALAQVEANSSELGSLDLQLYQTVAERTGSADRALLDAVYEQVD